MIVALARKLLIALCRLATTGLVPEGILLRSDKRWLEGLLDNLSIRGGGSRVSAWPAYRTENGSAVSELRCRSASAASWSGSPRIQPNTRLRRELSRPISELSSVRPRQLPRCPNLSPT